MKFIPVYSALYYVTRLTMADPDLPSTHTYPINISAFGPQYRPWTRAYARRVSIVGQPGPTRPTSSGAATRTFPYALHVSTHPPPSQGRLLPSSQEPQEAVFPTARCLELGCHAMKPHEHPEDREGQSSNTVRKLKVSPKTL